MSHHTFTFHNDPGHAWLQVPICLIREIGVELHISPFSYMNGNDAFLEEDGDAPLFLKALTEAGNTYSITEAYEENTPIRHYQSFYVEPRLTVENVSFILSDAPSRLKQ